MMDEWNRNRSPQSNHADFERDKKDRQAKRRERQDQRKKRLDDSLERGYISRL